MTIIILTSCVNVIKNIDSMYQKNKDERIKIYLKSVLKWLQFTNFKIILVENSGYPFDELNNEKIIYKERFEVITFITSKIKQTDYLQKITSKGAHEIFSINYAFQNSKIIQSSDFIIKITARYFIKDLENFLSNYDLNNYECLTQNNRDRCEMVGCHYKHFLYIFNMYLINKDNKFEHCIEKVWKFRTSKYDKILICDTFDIEKTQRGGFNQFYSTI